MLDGMSYSLSFVTRGPQHTCYDLWYILKTTRHPLIVSLHFAFQTTRHWVMVMEFCPLGNLLDLLAKDCPPDSVVVVSMHGLLGTLETCKCRDRVFFRHTSPVYVAIGTRKVRTMIMPMGTILLARLDGAPLDFIACSLSVHFACT